MVAARRGGRSTNLGRGRGESARLVPDLCREIANRLPGYVFGESVIPQDAAPQGTVIASARVAAGLIVSLEPNQGLPDYSDSGYFGGTVALMITQPTTADPDDIDTFIERFSGAVSASLGSLRQGLRRYWRLAMRRSKQSEWSSCVSRAKIVSRWCCTVRLPEHPWLDAGMPRCAYCGRDRRQGLRACCDGTAAHPVRPVRRSLCDPSTWGLGSNGTESTVEDSI